MATLPEYERFVANEPESVIEFRTVELFHFQFAQVERFYIGVNDKSFGLEPTAPRDAGQTILFEAIGGVITEPSERNDSEQALSLVFGNTDDRVHAVFDQINGTGFITPVEVVYRKYIGTDLTQPAASPLYLFASTLGFKDTELATFTAEDIDLSGKRSGTNYTLEDYPGLAE